MPVPANQFVRGHRLQRRRRVHHARGLGCMTGRELAQIHGEIAHDPLDHVAPPPVLGRQRDPPRHGETFAMDHGAPIWHRRPVLHVTLRQAADRRSAETEQDRRVIRRRW
jgi:hypothetical protein